ncbi:MAG TPA: hypothetical protein P5117_08570 [Spirochaetia bacterium]|nr:hypothetical protein [Spirochaetales bacterium]HRY79668.1 hypothetical protein [Spirochaetia bacterium]HRZ89520.1 hypothetical protein [Spirochaetia bacterium]
MRNKGLWMVLALIAVSAAAFAQAPDPLAAGGWEFGGTVKFSHNPDYPIFAGDVTEEEKGEYLQITEASISVGRFLADRFSLALRPSMLLYSRHTLNSSLQESISRDLFLGLGFEPSWYFPLGSSWILGVGAELGVGIWPGLPGVSDDVRESDHSLSFQLWLEPKVRAYYRVSELLAPYAEAGFRLGVIRRVRDAFGDPYDPGVPLLDEVRGRFAFTLGLKYFLPQGARFVETQKTPVNDWYDMSGGR